MLLAPGRGHTLRDHPDTPPRDLMDMVASGAFEAPDGTGGSRPAGTTDLVCGCFTLDGTTGGLPVPALPAVVHAGELGSGAGPWLVQTIRSWPASRGPGGPERPRVVARLCDALFVYILRSHLATLPPTEPNWLRALVEPHVGAAIEAIHADPAAAWTVGGLAAHVGMSRSAFAARFAQAVGEGPMQYLTRRRLQRAAAMLRRNETGIAQVATRSGYSSEAAFSKAFKRAVGITPGAYRRTATTERGPGPSPGPTLLGHLDHGIRG